MKTLLFLATIGQCSGSYCPAPTRFAPSFAPQVVYQPAAQVVYQPAPPPVPVRRHEIVHEGMDLTVEGIVLPNGLINWEADRPFNAKALADARAAKKKADAPKPAPATPEPTGQVIGQAKPPQNFGLDPVQMFKGKEKYTAATPEARRFVAEAGGQGDGPTKLHVTVIGPEAERKAVVDDLNHDPGLAKYRGELFVQEYEEGHWAVDPKLGFPVGGKPSIVVQESRGPGDEHGGKVVYRRTDYKDGPAGLAEALRKARPDYDPAKDPGIAGKGRLCPFGFTAFHVPLAIAGAVVVALILASKPKKGTSHAF